MAEPCSTCGKSVFQQMRAIAVGTANFVFKDEAVETIALPRLAKCKVCPHAKVIGSLGGDTILQCKLCDCLCSLKARNLDEKCPLDLW